MNTRTIVTVVTTALLSISLMPISLAQDSISAAQDGIEVITIIGKRPAPTVAAVCANAGSITAGVAAERHDSDGNSGKEVLESGGNNTNSSHQGRKRCVEQAATLDAHI
jgi:hypothetical protein